MRGYDNRGVCWIVGRDQLQQEGEVYLQETSRGRACDDCAADHRGNELWSWLEPFTQQQLLLQSRFRTQISGEQVVHKIHVKKYFTLSLKIKMKKRFTITGMSRRRTGLKPGTSAGPSVAIYWVYTVPRTWTEMSVYFLKPLPTHAKMEKIYPLNFCLFCCFLAQSSNFATSLDRLPLGAW